MAAFDSLSLADGTKQLLQAWSMTDNDTRFSE